MRSPQFDNSYARLPALFQVAAPPAPSPEPALVRVNDALAAALDLDSAWVSSEAGLAFFAGTRLPEGAEPIAMAYAGHQFGGWVPQLGDGRAVLLGEVIGKDGRRYDLQLKGSGRTRFSRGGDGKAGIGPVLREYVVAEAMAALGVPTTRALAAVTTGEAIYRQQGAEPGAILTRVSQSHVRVGTFQYVAYHGTDEDIKTLADYVIARHYPEARDAKNPYRALLASVIERQADLIAHWMTIGFIHGVMNTDNMQIAGDTIDYGPCAFMDVFHPDKKFSSIDQNGRYAWSNQPPIATWNLARFAETLLPHLDDDKDESVKVALSALEGFKPRYEKASKARFRAKLGLMGDAPGHDELLDSTLTALAEGKVDFTLFYRSVTAMMGGAPEAPIRALFEDPRIADNWLARYRLQIEADSDPAGARLATMRANNPIFIPRNHRIEEAIEAATQGDYGPFHRLVDVLARPFEEQPEHAELERAPEPHEVVRRTFCGT